MDIDIIYIYRLNLTDFSTFNWWNDFCSSLPFWSIHMYLPGVQCCRPREQSFLFCSLEIVPNIWISCLYYELAWRSCKNNFSYYHKFVLRRDIIENLSRPYGSHTMCAINCNFEFDWSTSCFSLCSVLMPTHGIYIELTQRRLSNHGESVFATTHCQTNLQTFPVLEMAQ